MKALLARESEGAKTLRYDIIIFRCKCHGRKPVGLYFKICIDYQDELGEPRLTNCWSVIPELTEIFARGRKSVVPGQIITSIGPKTTERQEGTYKVWLPKPEP